MEFTPVTVIRGTGGLANTVGFWSDKPIYINTSPEPTIHLLNDNAKAIDLLTCISTYIDENMYSWVFSYYSNWVSAKCEPSSPFFSLTGISELLRSEWYPAGKLDYCAGVASLQLQGLALSQIVQFMTETWIKNWQNKPLQSMSYVRGTPFDLFQSKLLLAHWYNFKKLDSAEEFLRDLSFLAELDLSVTRLFGAGLPKDAVIARRSEVPGVLSEEDTALLNRFGAGCFLSGKMHKNKIKMLLSLPHCASLALALLAREGHIVISRYLPGSLSAATRSLGMQAPFFSNFEEKSARQVLSALLMSSNIRKVEDIPSDLHSHLIKSVEKSGSQIAPLWKPLRRVLSVYSNKNNSLKTFDVSSFQRGAVSRKEILLWTPQWFLEEKYPKDWCDFAACAFESNSSNVAGLAGRLGVFAGWGIKHFVSPWEIKPVHLRDPSSPNNPETFFAYCKEIGRDSHNAWNVSAFAFKIVANASTIPSYPWYRENASNPFKDLRNPFLSQQNRGNGKTHRSRIATVIHEKLIEVLLDLNEGGKPTFQWAKSGLDKSEDVTDGVWCPSRWTLLAILLLLPLRKKQGRWLDQGLMDEMVFDPDTFQMTDNTHQLKNFTYEDGESHHKRYGRPSGAIQPISGAFMGATNHLGIFVNTNKTQIWNPKKHNGYELPWPDGGDLLASGDEELKQHGLWLRRVYEVLAFQYRYVMEHDPCPVPVTFHDVPGDSAMISQHEDIKSRMPFFVPLFRDVASRKQVQREGILKYACLPVSPRKLLNAYTALCMEVETRLRAEGFEGVTLTTPLHSADRGIQNSSAPSSRKPKFDLHCLRVAGISRLIEMDIDPVIVQEFVAGHLTFAMTHRYIKLQPWHVREKIIEAIVNGDIKTAMDSMTEKFATGANLSKGTFLSAPRFREHIQDLPEDFACFAVVEGGICVMGGKGDPCDEGGVYERDLAYKDEAETYFGQVRGGCGNCRHFRSAPFLIQEQALYLDVLMSELRALARHRKEIRTKVTDLTCQIDDCDDARNKTRLINDLNLLKGRLEALNHNMVPAITEWVNRYQVLMECQAQMDESNDCGQTTLVALFQTDGLTAVDLLTEREDLPDIGLTGRIIEKARVLECRGIPIPENHARMLEQSVDRLLRMNGSTSLLLDVNSRERTRGASMLFNVIEDLVGPEEIQDALDNSRTLLLQEGERDAINHFAAAIVETSNKGPLTLAAISNAVNGYGLLTGSKRRSNQWDI